MKDSGFTLTETLAALLIIGLAFGGLFEATRLISRVQNASARRVNESRSLGAAQRGLQLWMGDQHVAAALNENRLTGTVRGMGYPCGQVECRLSLDGAKGRWTLSLIGRDQVAHRFSLGTAKDAHLVYDAIDGRFDHWPPSGRLRALRAVSIVQSGDDGDQAVLTARAWIEQTRTCQYDLISKACRPATLP